MSDVLAAAAPILSRQHALITTRQALGCGADHEMMSALVRRSIWERIDRGLYGPQGVPMSWHRSVMAAVLLAPAGSLVSHRSAAHLLGVGGFRAMPVVEITIPRGTRVRRPGIVVHESKDLELADRVDLDGIPATGPRRLAMDLGSVVSPSRYTQTLRELRHGRGISTAALLRTYLRHKRQGRNGGAALRDWLDRHLEIEGVAESGLEQVVVDALIDAGVEGFVLQHEVCTASGRFRLDVAFPALRIAVEVDGAQHDDPDIAAADLLRTAALEQAGWRILRIRSSHLASDLLAVVRDLRRSGVTSSGVA